MGMNHFEHQQALHQMPASLSYETEADRIAREAFDSTEAMLGAMPAEPVNDTSINIRLPAALHKHLKNRAHFHRISFNRLCVGLLGWGVDYWSRENDK
jgi:predicted HicB family RNase H-like nuclease